MWRRVFATARREFKATVLTKAFVIGTFVIPVVFYVIFGVALASGILEGRKEPVRGVIGIVDHSEGDAVTQELRRLFEPERLARERQQEVDRLLEEARAAASIWDERHEKLKRLAIEAAVEPVAEVTFEEIPDEADSEVAVARVRSGDLLALIVLPAEAMEPPDPSAALTDEEEEARTILLRAGPKVRRQIISKVEDKVEQSVVNVRFTGAGVNPDEAERLGALPRVEEFTVTERGESRGGKAAQVIIPIVAMALLFMGIFTGAGFLMQSLVEEKSSRVIEVLLSGVSPMELMAGKILGQAMVAFTVLAIYGALSAGAAAQFNVLELISLKSLCYLVAFFFIGYFMYAAIFASIGAAVTDMREAQALQGPIFGILILFVYLGIFAAMNDTNSVITRLLSFVPPATPFVMSMRVGNPADPPPDWEVLLALAISGVFVLFMLWASAKIFRIGLLMYGKPPTLIGLIKWVRAA